MAADCCEQMELRIFVLSRQHFFGTAAKQKLDSQCVSKFFLGRSFDPRMGTRNKLVYGASARCWVLACEIRPRGAGHVFA